MDFSLTSISKVVWTIETPILELIYHDNSVTLVIPIN